jgi:hypothetical protein
MQERDAKRWRGPATAMERESLTASAFATATVMVTAMDLAWI